MVYKLYLKDKYGKKTLLAKSNNKELIENAQEEYDNKGTIPIEYSSVAFLISIVISSSIGYGLAKILTTEISILIGSMFFMLLTALFVIFFSPRNRVDGSTYIVWED